MSEPIRDRSITPTASVASITDSLKSLMTSTRRAAGEFAGLTFLDDTALTNYGPQKILNRMLSQNTYISMNSSATSQYRRAHNLPELRKFEQIGEGQCGTVWALVSSTLVLKIEKNKKKTAQLWNDSVMHKTVQEAFEQTTVLLRRGLNVPRYVQWIHPTHDMFWDEYSEFFPDPVVPKPYAFISSRIFPVPLPVRASLVDSFAPPQIKAEKEAFLAKEENRHCLIRLYLGRRETRSSTRQFRLRNFDLTVGEMEYLRLDTEQYAIAMARALAILHWKAGVDANDVEFVLGSSLTFPCPPTAKDLRALNYDTVRFVTEGLDFHHRSVGMWILDFDQCQFFAENDEGVQQLMKGFYHNDPYYPRPSSTNQKDMALWKAFKGAYLEASALLTSTALPKAFIEAVEAEGQKRRDGGSMFQ
ncbi:MAG: hypothetical protein Q9216_006622 [Gyalolechia sp. 2 TL-2023]